MSDYVYGGARALVRLHDQHLRAFLETWRRAKENDVTLDGQGDPAYASFEALLQHVLGAARGYMIWCCEVLGLPDPEIRAVPPPERIEAEADAYLEHVLARWEGPLREVPGERFEPETYPARWGTPYCIDAMLEHAVMHPIRHAHQLRGLLAGD